MTNSERTASVRSNGSMVSRSLVNVCDAVFGHYWSDASQDRFEGVRPVLLGTQEQTDR